MTWEDLLAYSLAKPGAWQDEPWEGDVVVKVGVKIFAFFGSGTPVRVKCGGSREAPMSYSRHCYSLEVASCRYDE
jgi:predicted DNA-binding protein (MmcQ/YjbR family)